MDTLRVTVDRLSESTLHGPRRHHGGPDWEPPQDGHDHDHDRDPDPIDERDHKHRDDRDRDRDCDHAEDDCDGGGEEGHGPPVPPPPTWEVCGTETIVNGSVTVPHQKPDVEKILRVTPVCKVTNWEVIHPRGRHKVVVSGVVEIGVEYVSQMSSQPVHFAHFTVPFHTFFLCNKPIYEIRCEVEYEHHELLDCRTISKLILLHIWAVTKRPHHSNGPDDHEEE